MNEREAEPFRQPSSYSFHPAAPPPSEWVSTGSRALDLLLGGGVPFGRLTEFSGDSGSGKTQLLFTLAVTLVRDGRRALFVDTGGTFRPERIHQIASARAEDPDRVLGSLDVLSASSCQKVVSGLREALSAHRYPCVLIDSLSDLFYGGGEPSKDTARLSLLCRELAFNALVGGILVAAANGVRYNPDTNVTAPQGAEHTGAYIHKRISLSRNVDRWLAFDLESRGRAEFVIGPSGIADP
jgi:DNA repair protein RadA